MIFGTELKIILYVMADISVDQFFYIIKTNVRRCSGRRICRPVKNKKMTNKLFFIPWCRNLRIKKWSMTIWGHI